MRFPLPYMIFFSKYLVPKNFNGITIFPFIFINSVELINDDVFLNHEKIHIRQQLELFLVLFYVVYFVEFIIRLIIEKNLEIAYRKISFEREAYQNESNMEFLRTKKPYSFIKYF